MDLPFNALTGALYSKYVSLKCRRHMRMPIQLLQFPCLELEGMTIRAANAQACALLGEDPAGRPFVALLDEGARRVWRHESSRRLAQGVKYLGETSLLCRKGPVRVRLLLIKGRKRSTLMFSGVDCEAGQPVSAGAAPSDDVLESDALADIAHEMRTPLTVIRSAAVLMRERPDASAQYLQGIERNCERLQRIVNDILALNATGSGGYAPARERVELVGWLGDVAASMRPQAQCRGIELVFSSGMGALEIDTDTCLMEHIVMNLLGNSLKFTPVGGRVTLRVEQFGAQTLITVADTGCGIPREELQHIFERGRTGDARRGSGIGLALAARCAETLGGRLEASSDGTSGSRFTFTLPTGAGERVV